MSVTREQIEKELKKRAIQEELNRRQAPAQPQEMSVGDQFKRQLGRTGRIVAEAVGALPNIAMDPFVATRNYLLDENTKLPSQMYSEALDAAGLPRAEGIIEKGVDLAGQMLVGAKTMPDVTAAKNVPHFTRPSSTAKALAQDKTIAQGERMGIPVHYDDVAGAGAKRTSVAAEYIPVVGTRSGKARQAEAVTKAIRDKVDDLGIGEDAITGIQGGLKRRLEGFKRTSSKLYDRASDKLDFHGQVPTTNFDKALKKELAEQKSLGTAADKNVMNIMQKYIDAPRGDFSLMRLLRSQIGKEKSKEYGNPASIPLGGIKRALEKDMKAFAENVGGDSYQAWKKADSFYSKGVVPFKQTALKRLVWGEDPERAWTYLVNSDLDTHAARLYRGLDAKGRNLVRYGLVKEAMDKATTKNGISPAKFALYLEKHQNAINTFFKGDELKEIKGMQNLMRHVQRAGQYVENPPTGQRTIEVLLTGGMLAFDPVKTGAALGGAATIKGLFQSKAGRDALIAAGRYSPGSQAMNNVVKHLNALIATQSD